MALFDNIFNNSQDPAQQQAALDLQSQVNNSVIPPSITSQFDAPVTAQDVQSAQPEQSMQVLPSNGMTPSQQQDQQSNDPGFSWGRLFSALGSVITDPAVLQSANAFSASMSGDVDSYNQNMNAYARTMDNRRAEQTARYNAQVARQQQVADRADERAWQEKQAYRDSLYKQYTADSVNSFLQSGDQSVLKQQELTPWQQAQIGVRQQQADAATTRANRGNVDQALANLNALDGAKDQHPSQMGDDGILRVWDSGNSKTPAGYRRATATEYKAYNENKTSNKPSANDSLIAENVAALSNATDEQLTPFTGQFIQFAPDAVKQYTSTSAGQEINQLRRQGEELRGQMLNAAVAEARKAGIVGVDRDSEIERLRNSLPGLDYSSPEAYRKSVVRMNDYFNKWSNNIKKVIVNPNGVNSNPNQASTTQSPTQPAGPSTGTTGGITMRRIG